MRNNPLVCSTMEVKFKNTMTDCDAYPPMTSFWLSPGRIRAISAGVKTLVQYSWTAKWIIYTFRFSWKQFLASVCFHMVSTCSPTQQFSATAIYRSTDSSRQVHFAHLPRCGKRSSHAPPSQVVHDVAPAVAGAVFFTSATGGCEMGTFPSGEGIY